VEAAATAEHAPGFPREYLDNVRSAAARLAAPSARPDDIRAAVAVIESYAQVDDVAPLDSTNRGTRAAKTAVRKAVFFTTHHLATQVSSLGWAVASLGAAAAERIERLEERAGALEADLRRELQEVKEHLARLDGDFHRGDEGPRP
jgi:hypothetical protein